MQMADAKWVVSVAQAPAAPGFLAALFGAKGKRGEVIAALQSITARGAGEAKRMLDKLPCEVGRYATEQEARVASQTLQDAGAFCEVREL
jgi:ribosomal protein L7/L12